MALGDQDIDADGYGAEEIACPECVGLTGVVDADCICCDGEGHCFKLIAPEGEIEAAIQNVLTQIKAIQRPH